MIWAAVAIILAAIAIQTIWITDKLARIHDEIRDLQRLVRAITDDLGVS